MSFNSSVEQEMANMFQELLNKVCSELYLDCLEFSSLNFLVTFMHVKVLNNWSNKSFNMLLEPLKHMFSKCSTTILSLLYEVKRKLHDLDLWYETIHACKYDWKEFVNLQRCLTCSESRYKRLVVIEGKLYAQGITILSVDTKITTIVCITRWLIWHKMA